MLTGKENLTIPRGGLPIEGVQLPSLPLKPPAKPTLPEKAAPSIFSDPFFQQLTAPLRSFGIRLESILTSKAYLKLTTRQGKEAKARVAQALTEQAQQLTQAGQKPELTTLLSPKFLQQSEFPILTPNAQRQLLAKVGVEAKPRELRELPALQSWKTPYQRVAHFLRLEARTIDEPGTATRLYEKAHAFAPENAGLVWETIQAKERWAQAAADPKVQVVLRRQATELLGPLLRKNPSALEELFRQKLESISPSSTDEPQTSTLEQHFAEVQFLEKILQEAPPKVLKPQQKLDQLGRVFQHLSQLRQVATPTQPESSQVIDGVLQLTPEVWGLNDQVTESMERVGDQLATLVGEQLRSSKVRDPLRWGLLDGMIHRGQALDLVSVEGLLGYGQAVLQAEDALAKAGRSRDPERKREHQLFALGTYAALGHESKVRDLVDAIEQTISEKMPTTERLQINLSLAAALHGSDLPESSNINRVAASLAENLLGETGGTIGQQLERILLAKQYFESVSHSGRVQQLGLELLPLAQEAKELLRSEDGPHDPRERLALLGQILQVEQGLVGEWEQRLQKNKESGYDDAEIREGVAENLTPYYRESLQLWIQELENTELLPDERFNMGRDFLMACLHYQGLTQGEYPILNQVEVDQAQAKAQEFLEQAFKETLATYSKDDGVDPLRRPQVRRDFSQKLSGLIQGDLNNPASLAWINQLSPAWVNEFAQKSQEAHQLLNQAKGIAKDPQQVVHRLKHGRVKLSQLEKALTTYRQAAEAFGRLGLQERVSESLDFAIQLSNQEALESLGRMKLLMQVAQTYHGLGMREGLQEVLGKVVALDNQEASPEIRETAQLARAYQALSADQPNPDKAIAILKKLKKTPEAQALLKTIEVSQQARQQLQSLHLLRLTMMNFVQQERVQEDSWDATLGLTEQDVSADQWQERVQATLLKIQQQVARGESSSVHEAAQKLWRQGDEVLGRLMSTSGGTMVFSLLSDIAQENLSEAELARRAMEMGIGFVAAEEGDISAGLFELFQNNPHAKGVLEQFKDRYDETRTIVGVKNVLLTATPMGLAFFSPSVQYASENLYGIAFNFGLGRMANVMTRRWVLNLAERGVIKSKFVRKAADFILPEVSETVTQALANMYTVYHQTGSVAHLTWDTFWKRELGSAALTVLFLRVARGSTQALGRAGSKTRMFGKSVVNGAGQEARALRWGAQVGLKGVGYGANIAAFAAADGVGEHWNFRDQRNIGLGLRLASAVSQDFQMRKTLRHVRGLTNGRLAKMERGIEARHRAMDLNPGLSGLSLYQDWALQTGQVLGRRPVDLPKVSEKTPERTAETPGWREILSGFSLNPRPVPVMEAGTLLLGIPTLGENLSMGWRVALASLALGAVLELGPGPGTDGSKPADEADKPSRLKKAAHVAARLFEKLTGQSLIDSALESHGAAPKAKLPVEAKAPLTEEPAVEPKAPEAKPPEVPLPPEDTDATGVASPSAKRSNPSASQKTTPTPEQELWNPVQGNPNQKDPLLVKIGYNYLIPASQQLKYLQGHRADAPEGIPVLDVSYPKQNEVIIYVKNTDDQMALAQELAKQYPVEENFFPTKNNPIHSVRLSGEYGDILWAHVQVAATESYGAKFDHGGLVVGSHEGVGKDSQQDQHVVLTPSGRESLTLVVDGMGGGFNGRDAARVVVEAFTAAIQKGQDAVQALETANQEVTRYSQQIAKQKLQEGIPEKEVQRSRSGAVAMLTQVLTDTASAVGKGSYRVQFYEVGDAEAIVIRLGDQGTGEVIFRTHGKDDAEVLQLRADPNSHNVKHGLGVEGVFAIKLHEAQLRAGDLILTGSDGMFESFGTHGEILQVLQPLLQKCHAEGRSVRPEEIQEVLMREVLIRQALLDMQTEEGWKNLMQLTPERYHQAYQAVTGQRPPAGWKGMHEGLYVDFYGNVGAIQDSAELSPHGEAFQGIIPEKAQTHFKIDNTLFAVQQLGADLTGVQPSAVAPPRSGKVVPPPEGQTILGATFLNFADKLMREVAQTHPDQVMRARRLLKDQVEAGLPVEEAYQRVLEDLSSPPTSSQKLAQGKDQDKIEDSLPTRQVNDITAAE